MNLLYSKPNDFSNCLRYFATKVSKEQLDDTYNSILHYETSKGRIGEDRSLHGFYIKASSILSPLRKVVFINFVLSYCVG